MNVSEITAIGFLEDDYIKLPAPTDTPLSHKKFLARARSGILGAGKKTKTPGVGAQLNNRHKYVFNLLPAV